MKRDIPILVRLTEDEKQAFEESAAIAGVNLSAWIRQHLRVAAIKDLATIGRRAQFLKSVPLNSNGNTNTV